MNGLTVAVIGATGAVGREMWRLLEASSFSIDRILAYTSRRSAGGNLEFRGETVTCRELDDGTFEPADLVLASAGAPASRTWSPRFAAAGAVVVDNSSAFRSDPGSPLVIPEVNGRILDRRFSIIANPNCSTIQMVMVLDPLHREWGLSGVRVATYQAASGAGSRAMKDLVDGIRAEIEGRTRASEVFPHPLAFNVVPQIGSFDENGESEEEKKMRSETRRLLDLEDLALSATCVRVPVLRGHSEAVWASFRTPPRPERARELLDRPGVVVEDDPAGAAYPLPRRAEGKNDVFVGRIRRDPGDPLGLCLWVVSDNLLKGAATNAYQIAELVVRKNHVGAGARS